MDEAHKSAYRFVIYWAMLHIRLLAWFGFKWHQNTNPFYWWAQRRKIRAAGEIAEWLHNAAAFSANDFAGFDEDCFWEEYKGLKMKYPKEIWDDYRQIFENRLHECVTGKWPTVEEQRQRKMSKE